MTSAVLNQAQFAGYRCVSRKTVTEWKKSGYLVFRPDGMVDVGLSERRLAENGIKDRRVVTGNETVTSVAAKDGETPEEAAERLAPSVADQFATKADAEKFKEAYLALLRKLEFDEKSGEVVKIAAVTKHVGEEYARVRSRLMDIPASVAPTLAAMKSAEEVRDYLEREISQVLGELSADDGRDIT